MSRVHSLRKARAQIVELKAHLKAERKARKQQEELASALIEGMRQLTFYRGEKTGKEEERA